MSSALNTGPKRIFRTKEQLRAFFMSKLYPVCVCALVLIGYLTGLELYLNIFNMLAISVALFVCDSIRPMIVVLCTFVFQISRYNTPADFSVPDEQIPGSNYYFEPLNLTILILSFIPVLVSLVSFYVRNKLITKETLRALPMLIPTGVLALAFLLGGVFSGSWNIGSLGYTLIQILAWFIIPYLFILGFKNEKAYELMYYLVFLASLIAVVLVVEIFDIYINVDGIITESGDVARWRFNFGWGNCNTAGQALTVLIPVLFIGTRGGKLQIYYFAMATLAFAGVVLSVSRSALLIGGGIYFVSMIVAFIKAKSKKRYAVEVGLIVIGVMVVIALFWDVFRSAVINYIERATMDDVSTGRFDLWKVGFDHFLSAPVFGHGFFGVVDPASPETQISFLPWMMHNSVVQILATFGSFGILAYGFYRVCSIRPYIKRGHFPKTMLGIALLTVLTGSLLDNFIFNILPMFFYGIVSAVVYKLDEADGYTSRSLIF